MGRARFPLVRPSPPNDWSLPRAVVARHGVAIRTPASISAKNFRCSASRCENNPQSCYWLRLASLIASSEISLPHPRIGANNAPETDGVFGIVDHGRVEQATVGQVVLLRPRPRMPGAFGLPRR